MVLLTDGVMGGARPFSTSKSGGSAVSIRRGARRPKASSRLDNPRLELSSNSGERSPLRGPPRLDPSAREAALLDGLREPGPSRAAPLLEAALEAALDSPAREAARDPGLEETWSVDLLPPPAKLSSGVLAEAEGESRRGSGFAGAGPRSAIELTLKGYIRRR